jgi:hypothetical protein
MWYFEKPKPARAMPAEAISEQQRAEKHGLRVTELFKRKYFHCPICNIARADINEAITCVTACKLEEVGKSRYEQAEKHLTKTA